MKSTLIVSALLVGLSAVAGNPTRNFPFFKSAQAPANATDTDVSVFRYDSQIFNAANDLQNDVRIFAADGQEVPFAVQKMTKTKPQIEHNLVPATVKAIKKQGNNLVILLVPQEHAGMVNGIQLETQAKNFEKMIFTDGSNDGRRWHRVAEPRLFCDYYDYLPYRNDRIAFPRCNYKIFRLTVVTQAEDKPTPLFAMIPEVNKTANQKETIKAFREQPNFKIDKIDFIVSRIGAPTVMPITTGYALNVDSQQVKDKNTELMISSNREPITSLRISSTSANFVRTVNVEIPGAQPEQWQPVSSSGSNRIFSCDFPSFQRRSLNVEIPETRSATYRVTIVNNDSAPLENIKVEAVGPVYRGVMAGRQPGELKVFYGGSGNAPVQYDTAGILAKMDKPFETTYDLGAQEPNPNFNKGLSAKQLKILLAGLALVVIVIIGFLVLKFVKKDDSHAATPPPAA